MTSGSAISSADREDYFRNAIQQAWAELEASKPNTQTYASALWRYCELLYQSSEYAHARMHL